MWNTAGSRTTRTSLAFNTHSLGASTYIPQSHNNTQRKRVKGTVMAERHVCTDTNFISVQYPTQNRPWLPHIESNETVTRTVGTRRIDNELCIALNSQQKQIWYFLSYVMWRPVAMWKCSDVSVKLKRVLSKIYDGHIPQGNNLNPNSC